jgi:hypothetical protein
MAVINVALPLMSAMITFSLIILFSTVLKAKSILPIWTDSRRQWKAIRR